VGKAGVVLVRRLADKVGLTDALSGALVRRDFHPVSADNLATYAELRLEGHDVITSKALVSPSAHARES
jgi:hypothetical protein